MEVSTPLRDLPGVGEARAKALEKLGLRAAGDLVGYFPRSYEDRRQVYTIGEARWGSSAASGSWRRRSPAGCTSERGWM